MPMAWGRGPTSDMSPLSTFQSWGSSSMLVRLNNWPIGVTRRSPGIAWRVPELVAIIRVEGAELVDAKRPAVQPMAKLRIDDRARRGQPDGERRQGEKRKQQDKRESGADDIDRPLDGEASATARKARLQHPLDVPDLHLVDQVIADIVVAEADDIGERYELTPSA